MPDAQSLSFIHPVRLRAAAPRVDDAAPEPGADPAFALLQLVDDLYRAAESDAHWPLAMAHTARALSACAAGFLSSGADGRWNAGVWHAGADRDVELPSADGVIPPGLVPLLARLGSARSARVVSAGDRSGGAGRAIAIPVALRGGGVAALVALRGAGRGAFGSAERNAAAAIAPHVCRALALASRERCASAREHVSQSLLGAPARGALLVDATGRVLESIGIAARLCAAQDGIALEDGRLVACAASSTAALRRAIQDVAGSGRAREPRVPALRLPRRDAAEPLEVRVVPLPAQAAAAPLHTAEPVPAAAVIVSDVADRPPADAGVLARLYGFTPAEAALAEMLAGGCTLEGAAVAAGLTRETMRSRLKGLFRKTGTRRQADLVAKLLSGVAVYDARGV